MKCISALFLFYFLSIGNLAQADEAAAWNALISGGYIALMRHTDAPGPSPDPPGFKLDDCSTQRNLSEAGRSHARHTGSLLQSKGVEIEKALSSPWCRCIDTARLMGLSNIEVEEAFSNALALTGQRTRLEENGRNVIKSWKNSGTLFIVTHGANIRLLTGYNPSQGEIVVVKMDNNEDISIIGQIPPP